MLTSVSVVLSAEAAVRQEAEYTFTKLLHCVECLAAGVTSARARGHLIQGIYTSFMSPAAIKSVSGNIRNILQRPALRSQPHVTEIYA